MASLKQTAFALSVLTNLNSNGFSSQLLDNTIAALFDWMIDFYISPNFSEQPGLYQVDQATIAWLYSALINLNETGGSKPIWYDDFFARVRGAISQ